MPSDKAAKKKPRRPGAGAATGSAGAAAAAAESVRAAEAAADEAVAAPPDAEPAPSFAVPFPVVGIGASAGGLSAVEAFFAAMPPDEDPNMAFVLVQHLSPDHKSMLVDLVKRYTRMQVHEAVDGMQLEANHAYISPPGCDLAMADGALVLHSHADQRRPRLTIDHFFASLAEAQHERAICIVMSGTGSDGTQGLRDVKGEGGMVIAQSPETAEYDGMPRSAIATGMVDYVLAPAAMPAQLMAYVRHVFDPARRPPPRPLRDGLLRKLCVLLRAQTGHDFAQYKETTLLRRMERRMGLHQIAQPEEYLRYARENTQEVEALFRDLLIGVTNFFRDPEAFQILEHRVIAPVVAAKDQHEVVRVWVCGCSTGEEAYSIAMLLHEQMAVARRVLKLQVFATDIDRQAIDHARAGVYPASIATNVSEERLRRFFVHDPQNGSYRIQKHIRDVLVFSEQDVIKDPPFSRLDLVSCRNLLIYLNTDLQRKLIPLFHYALVPGGTLFLGTSETLGESARLFSVVDRKWKIFSRLASETGALRPAVPDFVPPLSEPLERRAGRLPHAGTDETLRQLTERSLLAYYGQAGVLVNERGQILHIIGRTGKFLEPADGDAAMNIVAMAREGLRRELTIALHKAVAHKELVSYPGLSIKANGGFIRANLAVRPVDGSTGTAMYLVILEEAPPRLPSDAAALATDAQVGRIAELEQELRAKDEYLQTTLEEMETTNEELKSTNEELQSVNEELQSTNEELETSKEELQSVNEELSTVNAELQDKVADLSRANNDMNNLLAGTGVGTVFVDHQMRIARFTPAATHVINLIAGDVGRPLEHVATNFVGYGRMIDDIGAVLETLVPKEAEVQVKTGAWYLMRIRPYRTIENLIEGAVITLVDISERKQAEQELRLSEARLHAFINEAYAGVGETDLEGRFTFVNDRLCDTLGYSRAELLRKRVADITDADDVARATAQYEAVAAGGPSAQLNKRYVRRNGERIAVVERVSGIRDGMGTPASLLLLSFEVDEAAAAAPPA